MRILFHYYDIHSTFYCIMIYFSILINCEMSYPYMPPRNTHFI